MIALYLENLLTIGFKMALNILNTGRMKLAAGELEDQVLQGY